MTKKIDVAGIMYTIRDEYESCKNKEDDLDNDYVNLMIEKYKKFNNIVVFGSGEYGKRVTNVLENSGIKTIWCFCDNSEKKGKYFESGKRVLHVTECVRRFPDALYVITPKYSANDMFRQLIQLEIPMDQLSFFVMGFAEKTMRPSEKNNRYMSDCMRRYLGKEELIIIGCEDYGRKLAKYLEDNSFNSLIGCFCNSMERKWKSISDKRDYNLDNVVLDHPKAYYVITSKYKHDDIFIQLMNAGISCENMELFVAPYSNL